MGSGVDMQTFNTVPISTISTSASKIKSLFLSALGDGLSSHVLALKDLSAGDRGDSILSYTVYILPRIY